MRESSLLTLAEHRRALLEQASAALRGHVVTLWRVVKEGRAVTEVVSRPEPPRDAVEFDLAALLQRWGRAAGPKSRWVGCRMAVDLWHVAPVRSDLPEPPPSGIERRSPERMVIELAGLCLGALERVWVAADQATVYLSAALSVIEQSLSHVREAEGLSARTRAHLLADLAGVADAIDGALSA
jgi:hypothetical protein